MTPPGTLRPLIYKTLFGLIAATGLRISEALKLRVADIDLPRATLTVRHTMVVRRIQLWHEGGVLRRLHAATAFAQSANDHVLP